MLSSVISAALVGIRAERVDVEVDLTTGFPSFSIVGLGDTAVHEARDRVRACMRNSGFKFPSTRRLTVNLAPAHLKKEGALYDLPIAVGVLAAMGVVPTEALRTTLFIGELSLNGAVRPVAGAVPAGILARRSNLQRVVVAAKNGPELARINHLDVQQVDSLKGVVDLLRGDAKATVRPVPPVAVPPTFHDFFDIQGQDFAKRALAVACVGRHNVMLTGPPGIGKTLLAKSVPSILPPLDEEELLEVLAIYSAAGRPDELAGDHRPFRSPHHSTTVAALLGGGRVVQPGEVTLAHRGVLFLDELPEFPRNALEALRQPLEDGVIWLTRAMQKYRFPADIQVIAAANPCPCGWFGSDERECTCRLAAVQKYEQKMSGPLRDRFEIVLQLDRPSNVKGESSEKIRERVKAAVAVQLKRNDGRWNSELSAKELESIGFHPKARKLIKEAYRAFQYTTRGFVNLQQVARSIADLEEAGAVTVDHVAEALSMRPV